MIIIIPALIGAAAAIGGAAMSNQQNAENTGRINAQNYQMWKEQINQDNSVHQREVADLQAAGLNPILSAGGNGNPSGGAPTMQQPPAVNVPDIMPALNLALESKKIDLEQQKVNNQTKLTNAEIENKGARTTKTKQDTTIDSAWETLQKGLNETLQYFREKTNKPFNKMTLPNMNPGSQQIRGLPGVPQ